MGNAMRNVDPKLHNVSLLPYLQVILEMADENETVSKAVKGALEQIAKNAPEEFFKMNANPKVRYAVTEAARAAATEEVKLAREFSSRPAQDIRARLAKYLPEDRIKLIEKALSVPTFRMEITQKSDGKYLVQTTRGGKEFLPGKELKTVAHFKSASNLQKSSIIIEIVLLILRVAGIEVSPSESTMQATAEDTVNAIESSSLFQRAFARFISSWNAAGGNALNRAKAIFLFLKESYIAGTVWTIIESLCSEMKWYDWLDTVVKVTANITAALATEGAALIAEITWIVSSAVDFARKIYNLVILEQIKQTL